MNTMAPRFMIAMPVLLIALAAAPLAAAEPAEWAQGDHLDRLVALYRHFHSHPDLSMQEKETAARLAKELEATGAKVTRNVGGHGVVAVVENGPGKTLLIRTDLDALPVTERTELVYASKVTVKGEGGLETGVMHACGHDIHITTLVGVARYLTSNMDRWSGTVVFIGQPAEERGEGAKAMLDDGLFELIGGAARSCLSASPPKHGVKAPRRCSTMGCSSAFHGPISPWRCTSIRRWRRAKSAIWPAMRWRTSTASISSSAAKAG